MSDSMKGVIRKPRLVSIIIPAFNQLEYCRQCVASVLMHTTYPYRLILVDNGSTDGVGDFFDSVPDAVVVHAGKNLGFAGGVNLGLERAEGHVLLLNSDTITPRGWLERLVAALDADPRIGMVGPMSNCVSGSQQIDGLTLSQMDEINAFSEELSRRNAGQLRDVARLVGFCLLIREETAAKVGRFDDTYGVGNFEDDDYCLRVLRAGYRLCVAEDCFVFHYGGRTFLGMGVVDDTWRALIAQNEKTFHEKWAVRPEERCDAVQQSREYNRRAAAALEAGDPVEAIRHYKAAIEIAPAYDLNYNDLGVALWRMGAHARAFDQFARALRFNPRNTDARENLRAAAQALGREHEADTLLNPVQEKQESPDGH